MRVDTYNVTCPAQGYPDPAHWAHIHFHSQPCPKITDRNSTHNDQASNAFSLCAGIKCYLDTKMTNKRFIQYIKIYHTLIFVSNISQTDLDSLNPLDVLICSLITRVRYDLQQLYTGTWFITTQTLLPGRNFIFEFQPNTCGLTAEFETYQKSSLCELHIPVVRFQLNQLHLCPNVIHILVYV